MERRLAYDIKEEDSGQKVSTYLKSRGYSQQNLVNLKKDGRSIQVNGSFVHQNYVLAQGERLVVDIREQAVSENVTPVELPLHIIYEDEDLLVVNKAAGMPIHPSRGNPDNSLGNALAYYFKQQKKPFVFRCINRLDRDTSGLAIVAKHMVSAAVLSHTPAEKSYLAIVDGRLFPLSGVIEAPIARKEDRCLLREVDFAHGEYAKTHYRVLAQNEDMSLVSLILETGRTHQIRVHMQYLGHPLLGDFLYHPAYKANQTDRVETALEQVSEKAKRFPITRQALHAYKLSFPHPITGEKMNFCVPMPEDMKRLLKSGGLSFENGTE